MNYFATRRYHRQLFLELEGAGPHVCYFCQHLIDLESVQRATWLEVHHLNGDHRDNRIENLAASHGSCHASYHAFEHSKNQTGCKSPTALSRVARSVSQQHRDGVGVGSVEARAKSAATQRGKVLTPEHRAKVGAALTGKAKSPEHREKIAAALRTYWASK